MHWGAGTGGELTGSLADDESMGERIDGGGGWGRLAVGISVCVCVSVCILVHPCTRTALFFFLHCMEAQHKHISGWALPSPPHPLYYYI